MKAYGSSHEPPNMRDGPDQGEISALGLSSKHGKLKSKRKKAIRRFYKKLARAAAKVLCHKEINY